MSEHGTRTRYVKGCRCEDCRASNRAYADQRARYGWSEKVAASWCDAQPARDHIAALRAAGMGTRRIAEKAGVNRSAVDVIVRGKHGYPATRILRRNAEAILAVTVDLAPCALVDPTGTVRRIQALAAIGWSFTATGARIGWSAQNVSALVRGDRGCIAATAQLVRADFDRWCMTPGPSNRARLLAARRGWPPPLAWDDDTIDDPAASPDLGGRDDEPDDVEVERIADLAAGGLGRVEYVAADMATRYAVIDRCIAAGMTDKALEKALGCAERTAAKRRRERAA